MNYNIYLNFWRVVHFTLNRLNSYWKILPYHDLTLEFGSMIDPVFLAKLQYKWEFMSYICWNINIIRWGKYDFWVGAFH